MRMTTTTTWSLGTVGLCVALAAGGWFGLIAPERAEAAGSRELTVAAQDQNSQLEVQIEQLRAQYADLPARQVELAAIRLALPEEPALTQLIRDVRTRSADAGTHLDSLTSGAPVVVVDPLAALAPVTEGEATGEAGADTGSTAEPSTAPSTEPSAPPADGAAPAAPVAPVDPAIAAGPVLAAVPVTITTTGDLAKSTLFLTNVQADMPRALLVDSLSLTVLESEDEEPGTIQTVLTGRVFVFVDPTEVDISDLPVVEPSTQPSDG